MKTRVAVASARKLGPVEVIITVAKFRGVLATEGERGGRPSDYAMRLARRDPRATIKGDDLYIRRPGAAIRFAVAPAAGDKGSYFPTGIAFVREASDNASDEQRLGLQNFPQRDIRFDGRTVLIVDRYRDKEPFVRYKFSVVVQRGADGKLGIIDPGIIHEDD